MRPINQDYILKNIKNLTSDVFELEFEGDNEILAEAWQFITFLIPWIWARAYSILEKNWKNLKFIIKKIEIENGWKWWSKFLCEQKENTVLKWIWPSWHFILKENEKNKVFLGTGTGFVPLFNQIKTALKKNKKEKLKFIFWVRTSKDLFYLEELKNLKEKFSNFDFTIYLSREENKDFKKWYITDEIKFLQDFEEAYICWSPAMVDSAKEILLKQNFLEENIFDEKY